MTGYRLATITAVAAVTLTFSSATNAQDGRLALKAFGLIIASEHTTRHCTARCELEKEECIGVDRVIDLDGSDEEMLEDARKIARCLNEFAACTDECAENFRESLGRLREVLR